MLLLGYEVWYIMEGVETLYSRAPNKHTAEKHFKEALVVSDKVWLLEVTRRMIRKCVHNI